MITSLTRSAAFPWACRPIPSAAWPKRFLNPVRLAHLKETAKNILLIPLCPALGYFLIDVPGFTDMLTHNHPALTRIVGEGFGHAGLCFSLHFVLQAGKHLYRALFASTTLP